MPVVTQEVVSSQILFRKENNTSRESPSAEPPDRVLTKPGDAVSKNPAKILMLVSTALWPVTVALISVVDYFVTTSEYRNMGKYGLMHSVTGQFVSRSSLAVDSAGTGVMLGTGLYFSAMVALAVVWFATKPD